MSRQCFANKLSSDASLSENTSIQETWTCLEGLLDDGLVKNIGLRYILSKICRMDATDPPSRFLVTLMEL
jgi:hypothetical protein